MNYKEIEKKLLELGDDKIKKSYVNLGAKEELVYGVSTANQKVVLKELKKNKVNYNELLNSNIEEILFIAAMLYNPKKDDEIDLELLKSKLEYSTLYYSVQYLSKFIYHHAKRIEFIEENLNSELDYIKAACWRALGGMVQAEEVDVAYFRSLLNRVEATISTESNRTKYSQNIFMINAGVYDRELSEYAKEIATRVGEVNVDHGETSCKTHNAIEEIEKISRRYAGKEDLKRVYKPC